MNDACLAPIDELNDANDLASRRDHGNGEQRAALVVALLVKALVVNKAPGVVALAGSIEVVEIGDIDDLGGQHTGADDRCRGHRHGEALGGHRARIVLRLGKAQHVGRRAFGIAFHDVHRARVGIGDLASAQQDQIEQPLGVSLLRERTTNVDQQIAFVASAFELQLKLSEFLRFGSNGGRQRRDQHRQRCRQWQEALPFGGRDLGKIVVTPQQDERAAWVSRALSQGRQHLRLRPRLEPGHQHDSAALCESHHAVRLHTQLPGTELLLLAHRPDDLLNCFESAHNRQMVAPPGERIWPG